VTKPVAVDKKPLVKKGTSKTVLLRKPEKTSLKPKPAVPVEPEVKSLIPIQKETLKTPSEKKPDGAGPRARPLVAEKRPEIGSVTPVKEGVSKTPDERKPETISHPYSLYLGSFRTLERAKRAISIYSKRGLSPYCSKVDFHEKGVWFRVFTGHFQDREKAQKFKERHRLKEGTVKKTAYANLIGTYTRSSELEDRHLSLNKIGYFPYVIKGENGKSRLYVGAFITREGAEQQYHDLKSRGIQSQIVQR
jgi:cell division septation protein DedD